MIGKTINFFILVLLPLSVILMVFDQEIVGIIFERGLFDASDTRLTAQVMFYYTIGMLAFSIKELLIRVSYANHNTRLPLWTTLFGSILNIILSIILKNYMGVSGIALGLSISEILALLLLIRYMYTNRMFSFGLHVTDMIKALFITSLFGCALYVIHPFLWVPEGFILQTVSIVMYSGIYLLLVIVSCHVFQVKLIVEFMSLIKGDEHAFIE
jgi:putative peptidoglycan lipid II flippase